MPEMYEIYRQHADWYDRLVGAEDVEGNLAPALFEVARWKGVDVYEAGVGTGRVTKLYVERVRAATLVDRSQHMLDQAARNLAGFSDKLRFLLGDNFALPRPVASASVSGADGGASAGTGAAAFGGADIVIEGWAFGHGIVDRAEAARGEDGSVAAAVAQATKELLSSVRQVARPGATLIILETMGTATEGPAAPLPELALFYELLHGELGFSQRVISTDYQFKSAGEAEEVLGFFFGEEMAARVRELGSPRIPEWTGLWWRTLD